MVLLQADGKILGCQPLNCRPLFYPEGKFLSICPLTFSHWISTTNLYNKECANCAMLPTPWFFELLVANWFTWDNFCTYFSYCDAICCKEIWPEAWEHGGSDFRSRSGSQLTFSRITNKYTRGGGHVIPDVLIPQNSFYEGDGINFAIAATSIIAKTYRDRLMQGLEETYPG